MVAEDLILLLGEGWGLVRHHSRCVTRQSMKMCYLNHIPNDIKRVYILYRFLFALLWHKGERLCGLALYYQLHFSALVPLTMLSLVLWYENILLQQRML